MLPYLEIFGRGIPMYWLCGLVGLLLAGALAMLRQRVGRFSTPADDVLHILLLCLVGAMLGAKAFQVIGFAFRHITHPGFWTWRTWAGVLSGGGVFYGGLIGAFAAMAIYVRKYRLDFLDVMDLLIPSVPLFHAFGRLGCFCAGCCYGIEAPWGIVFTHALAAPNGVPLVPVQLFEAGFNLLVMAALLLLRPARRGTLLPLYLIAYAIGRFVLEFFRGDASRGVFLFSTSQWISLVVLGVAVVMVYRTKTRCSAQTTPPVAAGPPSEGNWGIIGRITNRIHQERRSAKPSSPRPRRGAPPTGRSLGDCSKQHINSAPRSE